MKYINRKEGIMEDYRIRYEAWLASDKLDEASKEELRALRDDETELKMRFGSTMEFGTGGLRSKLGAGTNRMNFYTVAQATEGVARLIESLGEDAKNRGVILGCDSRHFSAEFDRRCAEVLTAHGIRVYLFDELRPTPMLSAGVAYATEQIIDLFANGVNAVHIYTMNKPEVAERIMANLRGILVSDDR